MLLYHRIQVYGFVNDSVDDIIETVRKLDLKRDEDDNDQYAPEEAPADDQLGDIEADDGPFRPMGTESELDDEDEQAKPDYLDFDKDGDKEESMKKALKDKEKKKEEDEQIALSPQEIARRMQEQRRNEMQNFYRQERLNRHGY